MVSTEQGVPRGYQDRLRNLIDSALLAHECKHKEPATLRKLAASVGKPGRFNTLYKWQNGELKQPIRPSSFSLLCAIDPEARNPAAIAAYLENIEVSDLPNTTLQEQVAALYMENAQLKKRQAALYQLAAT